MIEHSISIAHHQLRLGQCPTGCQDAPYRDHWHEECECGIEYVLAPVDGGLHGVTLEIVRVIDHQASSW